MARIGIDARFYGSLGKGLGRYTQKLIENLEKIDHKNNYVVFLRRENFDEYEPQNSNFKKVLADFKWYSFGEQLFFPSLLNKQKLDLAHFPHFNVPLFYRKKFVLTIHDLILIHYPTLRGTTLNPLFYWMKFLAYRMTIASAVRRARKIFAVSEFTRQDISTHYRKSANKILVTYEATDDLCRITRESPGKILEKYGIMKPYLLYVGNVYPHKNPERLVLAMQEVQSVHKDALLVFVGGDDYFYLRLKRFVAERKISNVLFVGFVPDSELDMIFRLALAYVRPSLYEGFELPPLEAMSKGVPVLSSSHQCALEILGDAALYFDAKNIEDIKEAIKKIISDRDLRRVLIAKGYAQSAKYSWKKMAEKTLKEYENIK